MEYLFCISSMASLWLPFCVLLSSLPVDRPPKVRLPSLPSRKPEYVRLIKLEDCFLTEEYLLADSIPIVLELIRNITPIP